MSLKKLQIPGTLSDFVRENVRGNKIDILSIVLNHLYQLENPTCFHFDIQIISLAIAENTPMPGSGQTFDDYAIQRIK